MKYLLFLFFAILYEIDASCPNGTFPNVAGDKCYFIPNGAKQFILAELNCKQQNGDLASISNVFDNMDLTGKNYGWISLRTAIVAESSTLHTAMLNLRSATSSAACIRVPFSLICKQFA